MPMKMSRNGDAETGCLIIVAIIAICAAISWARKHPGTAAIIVCAIAAVGIFWYLWDRHSESERKRRLFDVRYGNTLERFEKDFQTVESNLEQTKKVADAADGAIAGIERILRTLS